MGKVFDVAITGATPAGLAAGIALARAKRSVVLFEAPGKPMESPLADWVPKDVFSVAPFLKTLAKASAAEPFHRVQFYNADEPASAEYHMHGNAGFFLPAGKLVAALKASARAAGVTLLHGAAYPRIEPREQNVVLTDSRAAEARILLIAHDRPADAVEELALPVRNPPREAMAVAGVDIAWTAAKIEKHFPPQLNIVALPGQSELGMFFPVGKFLHVRLILQETLGREPVADLVEMITHLKKQGLLPSDLPLTDMHGAIWHPPAGAALDLEMHVGKRTMLIGSAGGFAAMLTGQTIAPDIYSALLATDLVNRALDADDTQAVLNSFKNEWRKDLADYLRPPNTGLGLLLPLIFINQEMANRFAKALLYGESI